MKRTMQAAVFHGNQQISIADAPMPQAGPGEVLLAVRRTALCGSDVKVWHKGATITPGHEIFGVVTQRGHPLDGQRCLVYIPVHCGRCDSCARGDTHLCQANLGLVGWQRPGGYAEYSSVPEQCLLPVPDDIEDDVAALLLDTIGTAAHGIRYVQKLVPPASTDAVLVTGAGPVGMGAILALASLGYPNVYVCDPKPTRLQLATALGARPVDHAAPASDTGKRFALIVECSGAHAARSLAMNIVAAHGVLLLLGENEQPWPVQETPAIRRKDFYMVRSFYFPKSDYTLNLELLRQHKAHYRRLVDAQFPISQLPHMFGRFVAGDLVKPMLAFA